MIFLCPWLKINMSLNNYSNRLQAYLKTLDSQNLKVDAFSEFKFEAIYKPYEDSYSSFIEWYKNALDQCTMNAEQITFSECNEWRFSDDNKKFYHSSGEFYEINCYRITGTNTREVEEGWDQPFIRQIGDDGGILGILRKKINGVPFYLVEAKQEPGNYNIVQISTTLQATFSNIKRAHMGKSVRFSEYFINPEDNFAKVLFSQWMSEDGGRLFNKRNKVMLVEVDSNHEITFDDNLYRWVTLYDIKKAIIEEDAIIAPHLRNLLSAI